MESLERYKLGDHLGADRLADLYRATDRALGRTVTLKILRPEVAADAARREALLTSARAALPLSHPNVASLFQAGNDNGRCFFAFEHAEGETLRATIAGNPLNVRRALDLGMQVADALADAHSQGFVHGALNPEAIVITQKGRVKVLGFGLPLLPPDLQLQSDPSLTVDEAECVAPERVLGARGDARADIFSLGCILFEMLTGRQPFAAATAADTLVAILGRTPPPPSQANARIPPSLDRIVERCLAKSLEARAGSAAAVAAELREVAGQLEAEDQATSATPVVVPVRAARGRRTWLIVLLIALCLAALGALAALQYLR